MSMLSKLDVFRNRNDRRKWIEFIKQFLDAAAFKSLSPGDAIRVLAAHLDGEALIFYDTCLTQACGSLKSLVMLLGDCLTTKPDMLLAISITDPTIKSPCKRLQAARKLNNEGLESLVDSFIKEYKSDLPATGIKKLFKKYAKPKKQTISSDGQKNDSDGSESEDEAETPLVCAAIKHELNMGRIQLGKTFVCHIDVEAMETDEQEQKITPTAPGDDEDVSLLEALEEQPVYPALPTDDEFDDDNAFEQQIKDAKIVFPRSRKPDTLPVQPSLIDIQSGVTQALEGVIKNKGWTGLESDKICILTKIYYQAQSLTNLVDNFFNLDNYCMFLRFSIKSINKLPHMAIIRHCGGTVMQPRLQQILKDVIAEHKLTPIEDKPYKDPEYSAFLKVMRAYYMAQHNKDMLVVSSNLFRFLKLNVPEFDGVSITKVAQYCQLPNVLIDIKEAQQTAIDCKKNLASPFPKPTTSE